jgi:hypothetical protein
LIVGYVIGGFAGITIILRVPDGFIANEFGKATKLIKCGIPFFEVLKKMLTEIFIFFYGRV